MFTQENTIFAKAYLDETADCRRKNKLFTEIYGFNVEAQCIDASRWSIQENPETFCFSKIPRSVFQKDLDEAYEQIVYLQKNLLCFHQDLLVREL